MLHPWELSDLLSSDADAMFIRKTSLQQHPSQVKLSILSVLSLVHRFCAIDPRPCLSFAMASRWLLTQESSDEQEEHGHQPRGVEEEDAQGVRVTIMRQVVVRSAAGGGKRAWRHPPIESDKPSKAPKPAAAVAAAAAAAATGPLVQGPVMPPHSPSQMQKRITSTPPTSPATPVAAAPTMPQASSSVKGPAPQGPAASFAKVFGKSCAQRSGVGQRSVGPRSKCSSADCAEPVSSDPVSSHGLGSMSGSDYLESVSDDDVGKSLAKPPASDNGAGAALCEPFASDGCAGEALAEEPEQFAWSDADGKSEDESGKELEDVGPDDVELAEEDEREVGAAKAKGKAEPKAKAGAKGSAKAKAKAEGKAKGKAKAKPKVARGTAGTFAGRRPPANAAKRAEFDELKAVYLQARLEAVATKQEASGKKKKKGEGAAQILPQPGEVLGFHEVADARVSKGWCARA